LKTLGQIGPRAVGERVNREKVIEPSIANNEKNIECPPLDIRLRNRLGFYNQTQTRN